MVASRETLQDLAAERQLQPATLERVIRLIDILDAFGADALIGPRIAVKGGTALNVFHSDLDCLSVDIDVNYVGAIEKERMDADRPGLEDRIARLMESKGYAARREPSEHAGGKWIYRYASALGGAGTIEIDINYLFRGPLYGVDRMPLAAIGSHQATNVPVLDIHEIVAGKLVALVTRRAARDLFDARRIIAMPSLDWAKIKTATLMIGASAKSFDWRTASPEAIGCEVGDITGKLTMCLHDRYFDPFGGPAAWIDKVTAECREKLAPLFQLTAGERAFLDAVLERGEIDASSLGVPEAVRAAIEASPALRWKAQNVKAWKSGDKSLAATRRASMCRRSITFSAVTGQSPRTRDCSSKRPGGSIPRSAPTPPSSSMTASSARRPGLRSRSSKDWDRSADLVSTFSPSRTAEIRTARPKRHKPSAVVRAILAGNATWVDREGKERPITLDDIVIITPYNARVVEIQQCLSGARVGTVDKFQGQEAPIAIYSTATSSHADAPRAMEFLYSLNRLNVATSRAKCVSILIGSPQIFEAECRTPRQIQLANAFCRYLEMAKQISVG